MGIYIITGPSGVGKTAVINRLLQLIPNSTRLISETSRPPESGEVNGGDYFFVSREDFENSIRNNEFLEYEINYGNYYGTSRTRLEALLDKHSAVFIGGIDTRGARSIKKELLWATTIFLLPDSMENLRKRLENRQRKSDIQKRLSQAAEKISQANDFDHQIVNKEGQLEETVDQLLKLVQMTPKKIIGLDLDGVIIDHTELKIRSAKSLGIDLLAQDTPSEILKRKVDPVVYNQLKHSIYDDEAIASSAVLMEGALAGLESLKSSGLSYHLISRRENPIPSQQHLVILGLWDKYFDSRNTFFVSDDKNSIVQQLGVNVYIDDQIKVLESINVREKFLFDPLNVYPDSDWYCRVKTWSEFLKNIGVI